MNQIAENHTSKRIKRERERKVKKGDYLTTCFLNLVSKEGSEFRLFRNYGKDSRLAEKADVKR